MILIVFGIFLGLSLILIFLGLIKPQESYLALMGFLFLFILSFVILENNLQYKAGSTTSIDYYYAGSNINYTVEITSYDYLSFNETDGSRGLITTHNFGFWLAVLSFLGFVLVIIGLKGGFNPRE